MVIVVPVLKQFNVLANISAQPLTRATIGGAYEIIVTAVTRDRGDKITTRLFWPIPFGRWHESEILDVWS